MFPLQANGNIAPMRFVKPDTSGDNLAVQADSGSKPIGVSQRGTRNTPYSTLDDGYCAIAGENVQVYGLNETCLLELGGTVAAGDYLKPDTDGKGVAASSTNFYGARAGQAGTSGKIIEVLVVTGTL